ncbi:MAG: hypothetical protein GY788_00115 [bacterium]|nr:hypothetical protein [bacterium]
MNRRKFVAACGAAAVPGLALAAGPLPAPTEARTGLPLLDNRFSSGLFEAYRGEVFRLSGDGAEASAVRLSEVLEESDPGRPEQFILRFEPVRGEAPAADGLFLLEHPRGGKIALSLQPVSKDGGVRSLTASFSLIG